MIWLQALGPYVPLIQTVVWCGVLFVAAVLFLRPLRGILEAIRFRVERGSSLKAGPVELGEDFRELQRAEGGGGVSVGSPQAASPRAETVIRWACIGAVGSVILLIRELFKSAPVDRYAVFSIVVFFFSAVFYLLSIMVVKLLSYSERVREAAIPKLKQE